MAGYGYDDGYTGIRKFLNPRDPRIRIGFCVVLGALVLLLLWIAISSYFGADDVPSLMSDELHVVCTKCNAGSVVSRDAQARKIKDKPSPLAVYPDCAKCGEAVSCVSATLCPKCGKRFASESAKAIRKAIDSGEVVDKHGFDLICPGCKHDLKGVVAHD
ncbi:MAG: hypothetical protein QGH60_12210 [Phycisphaerae bacterium]|jgi:hypothetical protein|nr:hypothetical protein [Phycisphaerae bacterium]